MLESFNARAEMQYQRLTEEEKQRRGILGRLVGVIADFKNATRNGRKYTEELWDKTFDDPIVKEKIETRCILGELGHPADRQEIDIEKVAICLAEMPKKGNDGKLHGVFDILDTPNGRILKTLCDYGCNIGVSSRGGGETFEDYDGNETVDPNSYEFECFDAVLLPAVKAARPQYVTESFDTHKKALKTALMEALETSSEDERRVMKKTLDELNLDYSDEETVKEEIPAVEEELTIDSHPEKVDDIDELVESPAAEDIGVSVLDELQEALQRQQELEKQVQLLQEKLSVCYTKESRYSAKLEKTSLKAMAQETENKMLSEKLNSLLTENASLVEANERLTVENSKLVESVDAQTSTINELTESINGYRSRFSAMKAQLNESVSKKTTLDESLSSKSAEVKRLTEALDATKKECENKLQEALVKTRTLEENNKSLNEQVAELKKDSQILKSQNNSKLEKAQQLVEKYKSVAKTAVDKYISSQARKIGVSSDDIKRRLSESYSFKDIDKVVEDLQQYKLNLNSLPFTTMSKKKSVKATIRESKEPLLTLRDNSSGNYDDDVDGALLTFTN